MDLEINKLPRDIREQGARDRSSQIHRLSDTEDVARCQPFASTLEEVAQQWLKETDFGVRQTSFSGQFSH